MTAMLETKNLGISFGGLKAVDELTMTIQKGQLYGLIGPNGAGKTTAFNLLTGVYKPTEGNFFLNGEKLTGSSTIEINKKGIARTFQNIRLFKQLSVLDNVKLGLHNDYKYSTIGGIFRLPSYYKTEKAMNEKAEELLEVFGLADEKDYISANLPYGKQRKLEIARALATSPKLLLLDEHTAALDPKTAAKVLEITEMIVNRDHLTTMMITHNMQDAIIHGNRLIMMMEGKIILDIQGEEKKKLTVRDLLDQFEKASGQEFSNDSALLS